MTEVLINWVPLPIVAAVVWWLLRDKAQQIGTKLDKIEQLQTSVTMLQVELKNFVTLNHHESSQNNQNAEIASLRERVAVLETKVNRV